MNLLTKEIEKRFAQVGNQENIEDPIVVAKFFNPTGKGVWFATEYNPETKIFFEYVSLFNEEGMNEFGNFSLEELEVSNVVSDLELKEMRIVLKRSLVNGKS